MAIWYEFNKFDPEQGTKIVIVTDRGSSCISGYVTTFDGVYQDILCAEDGESMDREWLKDSLWAYLPDDYPLHFMEQTEADWY